MTARFFQARFASVCVACGEKIEPSDWVAYDDEKNLLCNRCTDDAGGVE